MPQYFIAVQDENGRWRQDTAFPTHTNLLSACQVLTRIPVDDLGKPNFEDFLPQAGDTVDYGELDSFDVVELIYPNGHHRADLSYVTPVFTYGDGRSRKVMAHLGEEETVVVKKSVPKTIKKLK